MSGLQKVLEHHKLDCKVQKDILHEAMKIFYEYQQVVTSLVKQKRILEKVGLMLQLSGAADANDKRSHGFNELHSSIEWTKLNKMEQNVIKPSSVCS